MAKAAIEHAATAKTADSSAITKLFRYHVWMLPRSNSGWYACCVQVPLHQLVGWAAMMPSGLSEVSSAHSSGMTQMAANTSSTDAQNQLKYRARRSVVRARARTADWSRRRGAAIVLTGHASFG